jgi:phosphoribosylglycinamide formyltransferase 1
VTAPGARIAVLASGAGTNLQVLIDEVHGREGRIVGVAGDIPDAPALARAVAARIPAAAFPLCDYADRSARDAAMADWLSEQGAALVVCAGYMALLTPVFLQRFGGAVVNVHPSLLPAFPGLRAIERALEAAVSETGVTVHLVDEGLDTGPVIAREAVAVHERDTWETLASRIREVEHRLLPAVVRGLIAGRGEV